MRRITLKAFSKNDNDDYKNLLIAILRSPKNQQHTSPLEIDFSVRIQRKIKAAMNPLVGSDTFVEVDEAEFQELASRVNSYPYHENSENYDDFLKSFAATELTK